MGGAIPRIPRARDIVCGCTSSNKQPEIFMGLLVLDATMALPNSYRWDDSLRAVCKSVESPGEFRYQVDENVECNESALPRLIVQAWGRSHSRCFPMTRRPSWLPLVRHRLGK